MNKDVNDYFLLNDLSIDRALYKKQVRPIEGTSWSVDNRGIVYDSRGNQASVDCLWNGSLRVRPVVDGKQTHRYVNDLVLRAFVGEPPTSCHVPWHRDGDRSNNMVSNLAWLIVDNTGVTHA